MTALSTTRAGAASAADPARHAPRLAPGPPALEIVVQDRSLSPRARRRRARLAVLGGVLLACSILFGLAGVHVLLTEGQFRLQGLQHQADDAQAQYVRLRLEVAELESPQRIVAVAQQRLGMVPPTSLTYLTPTGAVAELAPAPPAPLTTALGGGSVDTTRAWALAKPALTVHR